MFKTLWRLSAPPSAIIRGPFLNERPKREYRLEFTIEGLVGEEVMVTLVFEDVEAFRCTHMKALRSVNAELRKQSYGSVVAIEDSLWFTQVRTAYVSYCTSSRLTPKELSCLAITFDDGPCYEFVCGGFKTQ